MAKTKKWPEKISVPPKDTETYSTKTDVDDPTNLFLSGKILAGPGITVEKIQSYKNTYIKITNDIYLGKHSGLMYIIPTGINIIVENNFQYLIKDSLYITGSGSITAEGNAQIIVH